MTRAWTQEEIASWKNARDAQRKNQGLAPFDALDVNEKKAALEKQRAELFKSTQLALRSTAWLLGRYPLSAYPAPRSGVLELPRHHLSAFGCDRLKFKKGDNLNLLTYRYYNEVVDPVSYMGSNFVAEVVIQPKRFRVLLSTRLYKLINTLNPSVVRNRHEYLGPSPKVVEYRFVQDIVEIAFWDDFLKTTWIGKGRWDVELEFDPVVDSWFVVKHT